MRYHTLNSLFIKNPKTRYWIIIASLLASLFIYLFYRTEKTVVNEVLVQLITFSKYAALKSSIRAALPLNEFIIYSLPEGLWVFCITLTSKHFYIRLNKAQIKCIYFPIVYAIGLEIFQLFHLVNGRFDFMDIWVSLVCWLLALRIFNDTTADQPIFKNFNAKKLVCVGCYTLVLLSHVIK